MPLITPPRVRRRPERHYVAVRRRVNRAQLASALPPLIGEVHEWLKRKRIRPDGPPLFRYFQTEDVIEVDVGIPIADAITGEGRFLAGALPAGRYAITRYRGPYDRLQQATEQLMDWAELNGVRWGKSDDGTKWLSRVETYLNDPNRERDPRRWLTEIAILLDDSR